MRRRLCLLFACGVLLASAVARTQSSPAQAKNDAGQTNKDTAAAKDLKPIMMYRFYEGTDGLSHVEKIELKNFDIHSAVSLMAGNGIPTIHRDKPDPPGTALSLLPFHPAARRQYIFNLQGHAEIEFSGGEKITDRKSVV